MMTITIDSLISTSAHDAGISLKGLRETSPQHAAQLAIGLLERLQGAEGQAQRRQLAVRTLRRAARDIAEDTTADLPGPCSNDLYYTLPVGDLRKLLSKPPLDHAAHCRSIIITLVLIRGEEQCDTRRKVLVAALGNSAKALGEYQETNAA